MDRDQGNMEPGSDAEVSASPAQERRFNALIEPALLGQILVALPLVHLLALSAYLWAYTIGFGANIAPLVSSSDIFRLTITDMVKAYMFLAACWILIAAAMAIDHKVVQFRHQPFTVAGMKERLPWRRIRFFMLLLLLPILGFLIAHVAGLKRPYFSYFTTSGAVIVFVAWGAATPFLRNPRAWYLVAQGAALFFICLSAGLSSGYADRLQNYQRGRDSLFCGNGPRIIRAFSDFFIAVLPDNSKVIIDRDCKIRWRIDRSVRR